VEPAGPAWSGWQEEFAAAPGPGARAAMPVARAARLAMLEARAAWLVLLVARAARLAERRVGAREGLGRLRRGGQDQSRTTALRARELTHSGMPRQGSSLVFANNGAVD
jgi:hypothetical protein